MATHIYDSDDDLPTEAGSLALIELAGSTADLTVINVTVAGGEKSGLRATNTQRVMVDDAGKVSGAGRALDLAGNASAVYNEGILNDEFDAESPASTGIHFSGGGVSAVTNAGTIKGSMGIAIAASTVVDDRLELYNSGIIGTSGIAIVGGYGADRILNTGTIETTSNEDGAVAIDLGSGADLYDGTRGTVVGVIKLGSGNDTAYGGAGDETFVDGEGEDVIDGGDGDDTLDFSGFTGTTGISINLGLSTLQWTGHSYETFRNIENVIGTALGDLLIGNTDKNTLVGGAGDDTLEGGVGDDRLEGGEGNDTARYSGFAAVTVDLRRNGESQGTGRAGNDILIGIENLEGGSGADTLIGNGVANKLTGGSGNDTLEGGGGDDTLDGGTGNNTAAFSGSSNQYTITTTADGFTIADNQGDRDGTDTLKNIRFAKFSDKTALSNKNPSSVFLTSTSVQENTAPGTTLAELVGSDPDGDTLTYELVNNAGGMFSLSGTKLILNGAVDYEKTDSYALTLKVTDGWGGELTKTISISVRNVIETTPLTLRGTKKADSLIGEAGNDKLYGLDGNDFLSGNAGHDKLYGGKGRDTLFGGAGKDIFVFDVKPSSKAIDTISDFNVKDDTIHLARKAFTKLKKGKLSKDAFVVGDRVYDEHDRIIYLNKAGALFYDPDGTGPAPAVQFATIGKNLKITHNDFYVV